MHSALPCLLHVRLQRHGAELGLEQLSIEPAGEAGQENSKRKSHGKETGATNRQEVATPGIRGNCCRAAVYIGDANSCPAGPSLGHFVNIWQRGAHAHNLQALRKVVPVRIVTGRRRIPVTPQGEGRRRGQAALASVVPDRLQLFSAAFYAAAPADLPAQVRNALADAGRR